MTQPAFTALFGVCAELLIMMSGACLIVAGIFPAGRRLAWRLFMAGILIAVYAAIGYQGFPY